MNKESFNLLSIDEQFDYLNEQLRSDASKTRSSVFKAIGIAKTTVGDRAKSNGYIFNTVTNQYEHINHTNSHSVNKIITDKPAVTQRVTPKQTIKKETFSLSKTQQEDLQFLLENIECIKDLIKKYPDEQKGDSLNSLIDDIYTFKKEPRNYKVKSLRIDVKVLSEFESIATTLSVRGIRQQELLSYILKRFIDSFDLEDYL